MNFCKCLPLRIDSPCCRHHWDFLSASKKLLSGKVITVDVGGGGRFRKILCWHQRPNKTEVGTQVCFSNWFVWNFEDFWCLQELVLRSGNLRVVNNLSFKKKEIGNTWSCYYGHWVTTKLILVLFFKLIVLFLVNKAVGKIYIYQSRLTELVQKLTKNWSAHTHHSLLNSWIYLAWLSAVSGFSSFHAHWYFHHVVFVCNLKCPSNC